jgi:hypothetical protein
MIKLSRYKQLERYRPSKRTPSYLRIVGEEEPFAPGGHVGRNVSVKDLRNEGEVSHDVHLDIVPSPSIGSDQILLHASEGDPWWNRKVLNNFELSQLRFDLSNLD